MNRGAKVKLFLNKVKKKISVQRFCSPPFRKWNGVQRNKPVLGIGRMMDYHEIKKPVWSKRSETN